MTEQEIVNVLKENKEKGVAYLFLPEEVKDWVSEHFAEPKLLYLNPLGNWEKFDVCSFDDYDNIVFALPADYQVKQESKGGWVEFVIDNGLFYYKTLDKNVMEVCGRKYFWFQWQEFLYYGKDEGFTTFGGWQYKSSNNDFWFTQPMTIRSDDGDLISGYKDDDKPAIPSKIRFWKVNK